MTRVLVVDDDRVMRTLARLHLEGAGYRVELAEDAIAAAHSILRQRPDLMLVDVEMPHWDGLDFAATVRADPEIPVFPIIVMTASERYAQRAERLGLKCVLKPFVKDRLLTMIALHTHEAVGEGAPPRYELAVV